MNGERQTSKENTLSKEKNVITTENGIESVGEDKEMKNVHRDDNSPVEIIEGRLKRHHTNEIDGRKRLRLQEEKGGRAGKQRQLGRGNRRIS